MAYGKLRLFVKPPARPWGLLEEAHFDDNLRRKAEHRGRVLGRLKKSLSLWAVNFWQYRDADFCIEEQQDPFTPPWHIFGTKRQEKRMGLKRKIPKNRHKWEGRKHVRKNTGRNKPSSKNVKLRVGKSNSRTAVGLRKRSVRSKAVVAGRGGKGRRNKTK